MAKTGDLVISVMSDSSQFVSDLQRDAVAAKKFAREVDGAMASAGGGKGSQRLLELGRGAEDFSVGYQLGGLQMGLLGVANNIVALAASFSPMLGGIAGIGIAIAGILPMLINWANGTKQVEDANKSLQDTLQRKFAGWQNDDARMGAIRQQRGLRDRMLEARTADDVWAAEKQAKAARLDLQGQEQVLRGRLQSILPQGIDALGLMKNGGPDSLFRAAKEFRQQFLHGEEFKLSDAEIQKVEQLEAEYRRVKTQIVDINQTLGMLGPALNEAGKRQAMDEEDKLREQLREEAAKIAEQTRIASEAMADSLAAALQTPREKFDAALKENEGLFAAGFISPELKRRSDEQAVRELARSTGYLGQSPKLTGALRGSAAEFESRLSATKQTSEQLLEKQLSEIKKSADYQGDIRRISNEILKAVGQPPVIMEFN